MRDVGSDPTRWRDLSSDSLGQGEVDLDVRAAALVRQIPEPALPSAATMEVVRARITLLRGPRPRIRWGLTWALAVFALMFGVTLGAAAQSWISKRWAAPRAQPAPANLPSSPPRRAPHAHNLSVPGPTLVEAPAVAELSISASLDVPSTSVQRRPALAGQARAQHPRVKVASVSPMPFLVQPTPHFTESASESHFIAVALKKLRQNHDARGAIDALEEYRASFPNGRLGAEAGLIRVEALLSLGERAEALHALDGDSAIGQGPRSRELLVLRGELRASANRCSEAVSDLGKSLSASPHDAIDARALFARASCLSRLHQYEAARRDLERYQAHFPNGANAAVAAGLLQSLR